MKRILCLITFAVLLLASCTKPAQPQAEPQLYVNFTNTSGDWVLQSWKGNDMSESGIYLRLKNKEFTLWQSVGSMYPVKYTGSYNLVEEEGTGTIIRGVYDYTFDYWQHKYVITSLTSSTMEWTSLDDRSDVYVYVKSVDFPE